MKIDKGTISATDSVADVPETSWGTLLRARRHFVSVSIPYDCRELLRFASDAERMYKKLGFADARDLLRRGLEIDPELVTWAVSGLKSLKPDEPLPLASAVEEGKRVAEVMAVAVPTKRDGAPTGNKNAAKNNRSDATVVSEAKQIRDVSYLAGRIKAKAVADPVAAAVVAKVERGEYSSMRQAARDAGVLKPPNPVKAALRAIERVPHERLRELADLLDITVRKVLGP